MESPFDWNSIQNWEKVSGEEVENICKIYLDFFRDLTKEWKPLDPNKPLRLVDPTNPEITLEFIDNSDEDSFFCCMYIFAGQISILHSSYDLPSYFEYNEGDYEMCWHHYRLYDRQNDLPAEIDLSKYGLQMSWYEENKLHRTTGPANIRISYGYHLDGVEITKQEHQIEKLKNTVDGKNLNQLGFF